MNSLLLNIQYNIKRFQSFRKHLILDYKKGDKHAHTNPHAIPLVLKQKLLKSKKGGDWKQIRQLERKSLTPFGRFTKHGFIFQRDRLPNYDIPNFDNFQLQPYVEYLTPMLNDELMHHQQRINQERLEQVKKGLPAAIPEMELAKK